MDFVYQLWQVLLTRGAPQAKQLCTQHTETGIPHELVNLVSDMNDRKALSAMLSGTRHLEKDFWGWHALFMGLANLTIGNGERAMSLFETASETDACRAPSLVYLASYYLQMGQADLAEETIREGVSLDKTIGEFHLLKARLHLLNYDFDQADVQLKIAKDKGFYSPLGMKCFELENMVVRDCQAEAVASALELLRDGVGGVSSDETVSAGLGVLMACGALDEADSYLELALEKNPDNGFLLALQGDVSALQGRYRMASHAISRALALDKDNLSLLVRKVRLAGHAFTFKQGLAALDKIMDLIQDLPPPNRAVYLSMYGRIHFDRGDEDEAMTAYAKALETDPKCIPALGGMAGIMTTLGRLDEAHEFQDRMYQMAPVRAMQIMINNDRVPDDDRDIRRMAAMAKTLATPLPLRAALTLTLARVFQKRGEHDRAMDYADDANALFRIFVSYNHLKKAEDADRIIGHMTRDFFDRCKGFGGDNRLPLFILGMPRSGTTLVEQILGSHSAVFAGGELGQIPRMWRRLEAWERRLGSDFQKIPDCVLELTRDQSASFSLKVEKEYRELMTGNARETYITDKLPHNFKNIGLIKLLFPKARIIYCRRHAGGIALSNYFTSYEALHGGMGFAYDLGWIGYEIANCQRLMAHWKALFGDDIHIVDYENLVDDPEPVIKDMLTYLSLNWEDSVLEFNRLDRPVKTASVVQVRQPLYTTSKERWRYYEHRLKPMFEALSERISQSLPFPVPRPPHEPSLFLKGMGLLQAERNQEAEAIFRELLDIYPRHAAAMHMLGAAYSNQGKIRPAYQCMKRSIQLNPNNSTWYENLAIILDHMRRLEEAAEIRKKGKKAARKNTCMPDT